jgi:hypothetical protein
MKWIFINLMKTWVMLLVLLVPMKVYAANPAVFFSDMTDAPTTGFDGSTTRGAAVSIWGVNFGAARGTSTVTVCGVTLDQASDFVEWSATTIPYVSRGMQRITFFLKSTMNTGASTIQVTTSSGISNAVPFYCRPLGSNHIYFLAPSGKDSNNGTSTSAPWASPSKVRSLQAGDIAYFRAGTYTTIDDRENVIDFWSNNHGNGTANNSISIASYPGEVAQLGDYTVECSIGHNGPYNGIGLDIWSYWTFSKFNFRNKYCAVGTTDGQDDHIRFVGNDGRTGYGPEGDQKHIFDIYAGRGGESNLYFYGNYAHHCGTDTDDQMPNDQGYPLYIEGSVPGTDCSGYPNCGHHTNIDIGWNEFAFCKWGRGMQIYGHQVFDQVDQVYVHDNWIHDNGRTGAILGGGDFHGDPNASAPYPYRFVKNIYFYNNILYNNGDPDYVPGGYPCLLMGGEYWGSLGGNWYIYNNICYHSSGGEIFVSVDSSPDLIVMKNNIFYALPEQPYYDGGTGSFYTGSNNLYYGNGSGAQSWETNSLDNANPKFLTTNPLGIADFALQSTSPAIDAGTSSVSPIVINDFMGLTRRLGSSYDIGAFEYDTGSPPPKAPSTPTGVGVN